jgi:hypothetical protein
MAFDGRDRNWKSWVGHSYHANTILNTQSMHTSNHGRHLHTLARVALRPVVWCGRHVAAMTRDACLVPLLRVRD